MVNLALTGVRRYGICVAAAAILLSGCSADQYELPDRGTTAVKAEEERLAALLPGKLLNGSATCKVRLLGQEGSASFAWARCDSAPGVASAISMPVRVDGDQVSKPADGEEYAASIKRLFPQRLAEAILDSPDRLKP